MERQVVQLDVGLTTEGELKQFQRIQLLHRGEPEIHARFPVEGLGHVLEDGSDRELVQGATPRRPVAAPARSLDRVGGELVHRREASGVRGGDVHHRHLRAVREDHLRWLAGRANAAAVRIVAAGCVDAGAEAHQVVGCTEDSRVVEAVRVHQDKSLAQPIRIFQIDQVRVVFRHEERITGRESRDERRAEPEVLFLSVAGGTDAPVAVERLVLEDVTTQCYEWVDQLFGIHDSCVGRLHQGEPCFFGRLTEPLGRVDPLEGLCHPDEGQTLQRMHVRDDDGIHWLLGNRGRESPVRQLPEIDESISLVWQGTRSLAVGVVERPCSPVAFRQLDLNGRLAVNQVQICGSMSADPAWCNALHDPKSQEDVGITPKALVPLLPLAVLPLRTRELLVRLFHRLLLLLRRQYQAKYQHWYHGHQVLQFAIMHS